MIIELIAFLVSFFSGSLGVLNIIGSGFVFIIINTVIKLTYGYDMQWRIHLANFFISLIYVSFNFNRIFKNLNYLLGSLVIVIFSWGLGKILNNHNSITNFKLIFLVIMIILAIINVNKSEKIIESNENLSDVSTFSPDDLFIISFCSFVSSYFEVNFGFISCLVFFTVKNRINILDLSNIIYFNMLLYSILNFIWFSIKKEIYTDNNLEIYIFLGLILGAILAMTLKNKLQEKIISKIILISMLIYSIILFLNKAFIE